MNASFRVRTASLSLLIGLAMTGPLVAAGPTDAQKAAIRSACQSDYRSHCASVPPGGSQALQCLEKNLASLSADCQAAVGAATSAATAPAPSTGTGTDSSSDAAATDSSNQAATSAPETGQAKPKTVAPSPPPPLQLTLLQEVRLIRLSCGPDFRRYCGNVPLGGGNAAACLRANFARLAPICQQALAALAR